MLVDKSSKTSVKGLNQMFKIIDSGGSRTQVKFTGSKTEIGDKLLCVIDVSEYVQFVLNEMKLEGKKFHELLEYLYSIYNREEKPRIRIGAKCKSCTYRVNSDNPNRMNGYRECWASELNWSELEFSKPHIFDIWKLRTDRIDKLINNIKWIFYLKEFL